MALGLPAGWGLHGAVPSRTAHTAVLPLCCTASEGILHLPDCLSGSQCTAALERSALDLVTVLAASVAPEMVLLAAAGGPHLQTGMAEDTHLVVRRNVRHLSAGPDDALACHGASLRHTLLCVQTDQGVQGVCQHTAGTRRALCMHLEYVRCCPVSTRCTAHA